MERRSFFKSLAGFLCLPVVANAKAVKDDEDTLAKAFLDLVDKREDVTEWHISKNLKDWVVNYLINERRYINQAVVNGKICLIVNRKFITIHPGITNPHYMFCVTNQSRYTQVIL